ncbi:MAG: arsenic resistance protein [Candidatus Heimdallarchaeaceae archaeon]
MSDIVEISHSDDEIKTSKGLSLFEKLLPIWIAICMGAGILLSLYAPNIAETIDSWQVRGISIPIGICLFFMMYPAMLNLKASELKKLAKNPKPIILTLISNWIIAPFVGWGLARLFLPGNEQLVFAIILLASSPCTAMVLVWGYLADGNQEQNVITTSLNTITIIIGYVPMVALLSGISNISIDIVSLIISVSVFIGIPLILGVISKLLIIRTKGEEWFKKKYVPIVGKVSILALLTTLVVLFSLNGNVMITNFNLLLLVSVPLLLGFLIVVGYNLLITRFTKLAYKEGVITVIIGSSSHFEIAIATAIAIYGTGSVAALGTTMGLFWEIPIMLGLVYLSKFLKKKGWWKGTQT